MWSGLSTNPPVEFRAKVMPPAESLTANACELEAGISLLTNEEPISFRAVTSSLPSARVLPRLVKICTTPLAASEPYSELAAAPLMTSIRSMSSEAMSARVARLMVPSMMISGFWEPEMLVAPRSRMDGAPAGSPFAWTTRTPDTFPASAPSAVVPGTSWIWSAETLPTAKASFLVEVASFTPVTTSSSSRSGSSLSVKLTSWLPWLSVIALMAGGFVGIRATRGRVGRQLADPGLGATERLAVRAGDLPRDRCLALGLGGRQGDHGGDPSAPQEDGERRTPLHMVPRVNE